MNNQKGQVILILILVMTVALAIGLSVIQRSLSDISTSSKVEQSSRAFSAAEAGIERVLSGDNNLNVNFSIDNNSSAVVNTNETITASSTSFDGRQNPIECPPGDSKLAREDIAQIWLVDPSSNLPNCDAGKICYRQPTLDVYWGNSTDDKAALEVTIVYYDGTEYKIRKWYLDHQSAIRATKNEFDGVPCNGNISILPGYQCQYTLGGPADRDGSLPAGLMLLRARLLYNTEDQPFAVQAVGNCRDDQSACLPSQAKILISTGTSGQTQRKIQVCQLEKVVPPYFDYAIFSAGDINK